MDLSKFIHGFLLIINCITRITYITAIIEYRQKRKPQSPKIQLQPKANTNTYVKVAEDS